MFDGATYEWFLEGDYIGNPANMLISETGEYTLVITTASGCTIESDITVTSLSVDDTYSHTDKLEVFPNPAHESVAINLERYRAEAHLLMVYSVDGRLIHSERVNTSRVELNLNDYVSGVYILNLLDKSGNSIAQSKLIKQ